VTEVQAQRKGAGMQHPVSCRRQAGSLNSWLNRACQPLQAPSCFWRTTGVGTVGRDPAGAAPRRHWPRAIGTSVLSLSRRRSSLLAAPIPAPVCAVSV